MACFAFSSCSCSHARQPLLFCTHQWDLCGSSAVSSSSSIWASSFSNSHNQESYLIAKLDSAERSCRRDLAKWRAAAEPKRAKEEKFVLPDFFEIDKDATSAFELLFESAQVLKTAKHYEVVFLVHENHVEQLQDVIQKVKDFIEEKKGKIHRVDDWGMRKLAYKIQKAKRANYILMNIQLNAPEINDFKSLMDKDERIIRHLVITKKHAETAVTVPPPEFSSIRDVQDVDEEYDSGEEFEESDGDAEEEEDGEDQEVEEAKKEELAQV